MRYTISITDDRKRDAAVVANSPSKKAKTTYRTVDGRHPENARLVKTTEHTSYAALLREYNDDTDQLAEALIAGDPEIAIEQVGQRLNNAARVFLKPDGSVMYAARVLRVTYDNLGEETDREDFIDVEATVGEDCSSLPWSGRLIPLEQAVSKFAMVRKLQLRHINGLTFDFLYDIAKRLHEEGKLLLLGSGKKGSQPLIFNKNGRPYRGFLEGRTDGDAYRLVLHLSNLELKCIEAVEKS